MPSVQFICSLILHVSQFPCFSLFSSISFTHSYKLPKINHAIANIQYLKSHILGGKQDACNSAKGPIRPHSHTINTKQMRVITYGAHIIQNNYHLVAERGVNGICWHNFHCHRFPSEYAMYSEEGRLDLLAWASAGLCFL